MNKESFGKKFNELVEQKITLIRCDLLPDMPVVIVRDLSFVKEELWNFVSEHLKNNVSSSRPDSWWNLLSENEKETVMNEVVRKAVSEEYSPKKTLLDKAFEDAMNNGWPGNPLVEVFKDDKSFHEIAAEELGLKEKGYVEQIAAEKRSQEQTEAINWWGDLIHQKRSDLHLSYFGWVSSEIKPTATAVRYMWIKEMEKSARKIGSDEARKIIPDKFTVVESNDSIIWNIVQDWFCSLSENEQRLVLTASFDGANPDSKLSVVDMPDYKVYYEKIISAQIWWKQLSEDEKEMLQEKVYDGHRHKFMHISNDCIKDMHQMNLKFMYVEKMRECKKQEQSFLEDTSHSQVM